jgi:hypothetical protein
LHADSPSQVHALLASGAEITRAAVTAVRSAAGESAPTLPTASSPDKQIAQANAACDRLERALSRIWPPGAMLCAPSAFGKTVTAAAIIARRVVNTPWCWSSAPSR